MANQPTYEELEKQIVELKRQNEELRSKSTISDKENYYRLLFENSLDGFAYHQMIYEGNTPVDYIFLTANPAFEKLTQLKNIIGRKVSEVVPDMKAQNNELLQVYGEVAGSGVPQKIEVYFKPLSTWFAISAICPEMGYFITIFEDISERKKIESELKNSEVLLNEMSTIAKIGGWKITLSTQQLTWTKEVFRIHEIEGVAQPSIAQAISFYDETSKDIIQRAVDDVILYGKSFDVDLGIITAKGNRKQIRALGNLQIDAEGNAETITGTFQDITERKQAEWALLDSEQKYRKIIETTAEGFWVVDATGKIVDVNTAYSDLIGYSRNELLTMSISDIEFSEQKNETDRHLAELMRTGSERFETIHKKKDGSTVNVEISVSYFTNNGDFFVVFVHDITKRKEAEVTLQHSRQLLSETEKMGKVGGWEFNIDTQKQYWTEETYHIHELPLSYEPTVADGIKFYTPQSQPIISQAVADAIGKGQHFDVELQIVTAKGNIKDVHAIGRTDMVQKRVFGFFQDITDRKTTEKALRKSEEKFRVLFETLPTGITLAGLDGAIIESNPAAERILGLSAEEHRQRSIDGVEWSIVRPDGTLMPAEEYPSVRALNENKAIYQVEMGVTKGVDNIAWISVNAIPITDYGIVISYEEVTARKQAQLIINKQNEELKRANDDKDRFISIIAHDLRSPFNTLLGFSELLTENIHTYDIAKIEKQVNIIHQIAELTHNLLDNLLVWARSQSGRMPYDPVEINCSEICREVIENTKTLSASKEIKTVLDVDTGIYFMVDVNMFKTVLSNLVSNAVKFTKPGGRIDIRVKNNSENTTITVADTGVGMEQEVIDRLFDITQKYSATGTANEKGTGFGLILCKEFVEKHKGEIWVKSEIGKGSSFTFTIPNHSGTQKNDTPNSNAKKTDANVILVAEDEEYNFLLIEEVLSGMDLKLIHAKNGREAIEICSTDIVIELVLMDIKMPVMDGYTAAQQIKEFRPDVPIIAQSAYALANERTKYGQTTFVDYITKPLNPTEFRQKVLQYISKNK